MKELKKDTMKNRIIEYDIARVLCTLWIVGIWHLQEYFEPSNLIKNDITSLVTIGVLATFTFISATFMPRVLNGKREVFDFYKRRLKRFYILYVLSCTSLFVISIFFGLGGYFYSTKQLLLSLIGGSCLFGPPPLTLWYFSMLIFFYLLTPFICIQKSNKRRALIIASIYVLLILGAYSGSTDKRILIYYPIYFIMFLFKDPKEILRRIKKISFVGTIGVYLWVIFSVIWLAKYEGIIAQLYVGTLLIIAIILLAISLSKLTFLDVVWKKMSYASMCAYLFHRQFYGVVKYLMGPFNLICSFAVILPLLFLSCYFCQEIYDNILKRES